MKAASVLDRAAAVAFRRLKRAGGDPRRLPVPDQTLVVIYSAQGIMDNGGFRYFFENNWPGRPPYSVFSDAYRRIGALQPAELLDRAVAFFPFPRPHLAMRKRNRFLDSLPEDHELFALGFRICGDPEVWEHLEAYVRNHLAAFWKRPKDALRRGKQA